jgi:hypothetical protein
VNLLCAGWYIAADYRAPRPADEAQPVRLDLVQAQQWQPGTGLRDEERRVSQIVHGRDCRR